MAMPIGRNDPVDAVRRRDFLAVWIGVLLTAAAYGWTLFSANPSFVTRDASDHYGYLTDALLSGQLHLKLEPDPKLAELANPYAGSQDIPRLHDATYFGGHYFLYFGPTPVVLLLGPWHLVTRTFMREGMATVVFSFAGFLMGARLWLSWKRQFMPALGSTWTGLAVLMLGLGNYVFFLIQSPSVYAVPISCAYACLMGAFGFVVAALRSDAPSGRVRGLGLASLALGMAAGARPDYVFALPALCLPLAVLWRDERERGGPGGTKGGRLILWAVAPAAAVGLVLAAYNRARFGDFLEFGVKYQLASTDQRATRVTDLSNLAGGIHEYLFPPPHYFAHFPFLSLSADTFGLLPWAPFALAALAFPLTCLPVARRGRVWTTAGGFMLLACLLNFLAVCVVSFRNARYVIDFIPAATWLALLVTGACLSAKRTLPRLAGGALVAAAGFTLLHSVLLGLSLRTLPGLAHALDYPAAAIEGLAGVRYGPLRIEMRLPDAPVFGRSEALLTTADGADVLYEIQPDKGHVQFRFFHRGSGGPTSNPVAIDPTRAHSLELDMGTLYPPSEHPFFSNWRKSLVDAVHRQLVVRLDGETVLDRAADFYPNDYYHTAVGPAIAGGGVDATFTGKILGITRGPLPDPDKVKVLRVSGPVRIKLRFPTFRAIYGEPLLSTGTSGAGDLIYVTYLGPGRVRFGHDCWNYGPAETRTVTFDPALDQTLDVDMGTLDPGHGQPVDGRSRFQLRFNGELIASASMPFHPTDPEDVAFGINAIHASTAAATFTGPVFEVHALPAFPPPPTVAAGRGAVHLTARFPTNDAGKRQPLVVTGRRGAGDAVYVVYVDDTHIRFGYGHWGAGAQEGPPVAVDYGFAHELSIDMGSLNPAGGDTVRVKCDGTGALDAKSPAFAAQPGEIAVGTNPIGCPSCGPRFDGIITLAVQMP